MEWQKFEQSFAIKFCVKLGESTTVTYEMLQRAYGGDRPQGICAIRTNCQSIFLSGSP